MTGATLLVELLTEELPPKALYRLGEAFADGLFKGLVDRKLGLAGHGLDDAFGLDGLEAARVDDDVGTRTDAALTVLTVAGGSGFFIHYGSTRFGEPVKQGRFSHVGSTHNCNNISHCFFVYLLS